jgi:hypothetical protein
MKLNSVAAKTIAKPAAGRANILSSAPRASKVTSDDDDDFDDDDDLEILEDEDIDGDFDDDITEINVKEPATFEDFDDEDDDDDDDF